MKRTIAVLLACVMVLVLAAPSAALAAGKSGKSKGSGSASHGKGQSVDKVRGKSGEHKDKDADETDDAKTPPGQAKKAERASEETSAQPKLTGIENALSRIQRNLERMSAKMAEGKRTSLPSGLLAVAAKFISWLSGGAPSGEPSGTVEPTSTVEPTTTLIPVP